MSDSHQEILKRLDSLEQRLSRIESLLGQSPTAEPSDEPLEFVFEVLDDNPARPVDSVSSRCRLSRGTVRSVSPRSFATLLLGWGGVAAMVLAATYLVKLGIDLGWLTPARQVMLAVIGALGLIGTGIALRRSDRHYASLLPAGGIAILYLSTYGAHLYYRLIPMGGALAAIVVSTLLSLWLCHLFRSELYAFFAVVGSYSAPLLLDGLRTGVSELALYYTAWSLLFSLFGIWFGRRGIYLLAAYLALIGFDLVWYLQWRSMPHPPWGAALLFQGLQALIFAVATALFSIHREEPLDRQAAYAHLPPLLLFYVLEYALLSRYLSQWAPWVAIGSAAVVAGLYLVVRQVLQRRLEGGDVLLSVYVAIVLFHAGYLESVPAAWHPWVGLLAGAAGAVWLVRIARSQALLGSASAVLAALGLIFCINYFRALMQFDLDAVVGGRWLALCYALELYGGYLLVRSRPSLELARYGLVYAGHLSAMAAALQLFSHRFTISLAWCLLAVGCLVLSLKLRDRILGQSSLLVFAAAALKVLVYDLQGASPLVRVACLLVLGVTCYLGGWLYRKVSEFD